MIEKYDPLQGEMFQILDENGQVKADLEPQLPESELKRIYSLMMLTRAADLKALRLQRQGRLGTFAPSLGHEACQVGSAFPLQNVDWVFPYFRDLGTYLTLGLPLKNYYLYWIGHEEGMRIPEGLNIFPISVPVASQIPQAVGFAMAARFRKDPVVAVTYFGDGATSEGDFNEGLNFAAVFNAPSVFICYNNQYAISTPVRKQTASRTIAQKALAYGFPGVLVDGNDVLAMYSASKEAIDNARAGKGPTLIEAFTYRMGDHTTSDDASKYRTQDEVKEWEGRDPIQRFRAYLQKKDYWNEAFEREVQNHVEETINKAVEETEKTPLPSVEDLFRFTYKIMPRQLEEQLAELKKYLEEVGR